MSERIHRYLDGELDFKALSAEERQELAKYREALHETLESLPRERAPDLAPHVMRRLAATGQLAHAGPESRRAGSRERSVGSLARVFRLLWQPRTFTLRPAYAIVIFGAAALLLLGRDEFAERRGGVPVQQGGTAVVVDGSDATTVRVRFRLDAPSASSVSLAGDFTGWQPTLRLREEAPGVWSTVVPLTPGVHDYAFVIDGSEWVLDPLAQSVDDGFGGQNSRVAVLVQGRRS
jgi:hypothetical protein